MPTVHWLSENGMADLACDAVSQEQGSGWLYMVQGPFPTLGENLHPDGYGTRHHPFSSCIGSWMFKDLAGIRPDPTAPGFHKFFIAPGVVRSLAWVKASFNSPSGRIESAWRRDASSLTLTVSIPPNTTATVAVPAPADAITEGGRPAAQAPGVRFRRREAHATLFEVGSGHYAFSAPL